MRRHIWTLVLATALVAFAGCSGDSPFFPDIPPVDTTPKQVYVDTSGLSAEAKLLVLPNITYFGAFTRWPDGKVIRVYADTTVVNLADVHTALNFWAGLLSGKVTFQVTDNRSQADVVLEGGAFNGLLENQCASATPTTVEKHVILEGKALFANKLKPTMCAPKASVGTVAHEMGHIIGLMGHTSPFLDLMSAPVLDDGKTLVASSAIIEATHWLYSIEPGALPVSGG